MSAREWKFGSFSVSRFCSDPAAPVLYAHVGKDEAAALAECGWTVISIGGVDWNRDLTPWPAKSVFQGQPDFGGGAGDYLRILTEKIIPAVEEDLQPAHRAIIGYSLAGLFAAFAAMEMNAFDAFASVSGSMWYPGFAEYAVQKNCNVKGAYFSVGDREKLGRNAAFHSIEECTQKVCDSLAERGTKTVFELNPGGHFDDPAGRMQKAVRWLTKQVNER